MLVALTRLPVVVNVEIAGTGFPKVLSLLLHAVSAPGGSTGIAEHRVKTGPCHRLRSQNPQNQVRSEGLSFASV